MLYPLKFHPILKQKIWGGNKLKTALKKPSENGSIGESWEISTVDDEISIVSNGELAGTNLMELIKLYKGDLLGNKVYAKFKNQFPLLIKIIDAKEDLSVQVHPDDKFAKRRHNSLGKTEMWYVMQADKDAKLIVGFNKKTNKTEYQNYLRKERIEELLNYEEIVRGDSYFIQAGSIHAIGAGCLIAEIQQASDITYRVYDWNRKDGNGKTRQVHTDLALDVLDFGSNQDFKLCYSKSLNRSNKIISDSNFTTNFLKIDKNIKLNYSKLDSFVIFICVSGSAIINMEDREIKFSYGDTIMIPAILNEITINSNNLELLEVSL